MSALLDPRGCLTDAGLAALAGSAPGQAPKEVAGHIVACPRCQDRMLAGARAEIRARRKTAPPPWRIWVVLGACILLLLSILATIERLR